MTKPLLPDIIEATRLTQNGRLSEATALLQKLLSGAHQAHEAEPDRAAHSVPPMVIDAVAVEVNPQSPRSEHSATPQSAEAANGNTLSLKNTLAEALRGLKADGLRPALPLGLKGAPPSPSDVFPSNGSFVAKSFRNEAGSRPYKLYIPSGRHDEPRPLILMLHGCTQSPDDFAAGTRMNFAAEVHGCFVAYPEQTAAANSSKCWNWFQSSHQARNQGEPSLIAGIATEIMTAHNIDPRRVYIAGLSAGGAAAGVVAEAYPDIFAALGVHSGLACGAARDLPSAFAAMQGQHAGSAPAGDLAIPTIVFHGDRDTTVHPKNGAEIVARAAAAAPGHPEIAEGRVNAGRSYTRSVRRSESGKDVIEEWVIHGAGHAWSGGSAAGSYTDPLGPDATKEMLRFFLQHERQT